MGPNLDYALLYLGRTRLEMNDHAGAAEVLERLVETAPEHPTARYFLGEAYGRLGRMEKAHFQLGLHYKRKGDFKTAAFHLSRVLKATSDAEKKAEIEKRLAEVEEEERAASRREAEATEPRRKKLR
jgi:predicted Zn-dependent protease